MTASSLVLLCLGMLALPPPTTLVSAQFTFPSPPPVLYPMPPPLPPFPPPTPPPPSPPPAGLYSCCIQLTPHSLKAPGINP
jgi:hypothetical protein